MKVNDIVMIQIGLCAGQSARIVDIDEKKMVATIVSSLGWTDIKPFDMLQLIEEG